MDPPMRSLPRCRVESPMFIPAGSAIWHALTWRVDSPMVGPSDCTLRGSACGGGRNSGWRPLSAATAGDARLGSCITVAIPSGERLGAWLARPVTPPDLPPCLAADGCGLLLKRSLSSLGWGIVPGMLALVFTRGAASLRSLGCGCAVPPEAGGVLCASIGFGASVTGGMFFSVRILLIHLSIGSALPDCTVTSTFTTCAPF
mmetsp:Transcript_74520/g.147605  ORF Transcript_74520/g.147605 Transcript_74520/m.147605 type:complete len:202 (-) Transcript_74520:546-1151(-)